MADTLRDALTAAYEAQEKVETPEPNHANSVSAEPQKEVATKTVERDESGKFKAVFQESEANKNIEQKEPNPSTQQETPKRNPPSNWKKDYWEAYQSLDPQLADYIALREKQFTNGVSTYKQEAERAKSLFEAMAPFQDELSRYGVRPEQFLSQLGQAHLALTNGSPHQKLIAFQNLAQQYGVPIQSIASGQIDPVMEYLSPLQEQVRQLQGQLTGWQQQQQMQEQAQIQNEINNFAKGKEHFETVKETMAGLLQSGLAQDLEGAYSKALRMHDDLWQSEQQRIAQEAEQKRRQAEQERVASAKAKVTSVRSSTPANMSNEGKKGLRAQLEESYDQLMGTARV